MQSYVKFITIEKYRFFYHVKFRFNFKNLKIRFDKTA